MIAIPAGMRIVVARRPVDFRNGLDGLAALVQEALRANPFAGDLFVFRAKRADRVKILAWDGTGLCLFHRHRQVVGCRMSDDERRGVPAVDRRDYAAIATPLTSAQVVNAWFRAE
jgi:hypothetical protein